MIRLTTVLFALISLSSTAAAQAVLAGAEGHLGQRQRERVDGDGRIGWRERRAALGRHRVQEGLRDAAHEALRDRFDADGDDRIDADEREAARTALRRRIEEGRKERVEELRRRVDLDADGRIDTGEREAARGRIEKRLRGVRERRLERGGPPRARYVPQPYGARARDHDRCEGRREAGSRRGASRGDERPQAHRRRGRRV